MIGLESVPLRGSVWLKRVAQACGSDLFSNLRLCRSPCGKPLAFRPLQFSKAAMPLRRSLEEFHNRPRKARGFPHGGRQSREFGRYIASLNVAVSPSPRLAVTHSHRLPVSVFHIRPVAINNSAFRIAAPAAPRIVL